jgi:GNAT superfamily N-acetyltransferase
MLVVQAPASVPEWAEVVTAAERPDLWLADRTDDRFLSAWPEYNLHGEKSGEYFGALFPKYDDFQLLILDTRDGEVVARGRTIPFRWDGSLEDLPRGIDAVGIRAIEDEAQPTALSALAAEVTDDFQRQGLSGVVIEAMALIARAQGLRPLVAPVRPTWKDRYPLTAIERYMRWCRSDGLPFDPWMRVHARLGATILRGEPQSMEISGPVADWESWVGIEFPDDGDYVFPGGLAPLTVDAGTGHYWEPNVWMRHDT